MKNVELTEQVIELATKCKELFTQMQKDIEELKAKIEQPEKPHQPTYEDVANELKTTWYFTGDGVVVTESNSFNFFYASEETAKREALRCKWLNIAEYVNRKYEKKSQYHFCINWLIDDNAIEISAYYSILSENTRFNSEAAAKEALAIMGENNYRKMIGV